MDSYGLDNECNTTEANGRKCEMLIHTRELCTVANVLLVRVYMGKVNVSFKSYNMYFKGTSWLTSIKKYHH